MTEKTQWWKGDPTVKVLLYRLRGPEKWMENGVYLARLAFFSVFVNTDNNPTDPSECQRLDYSSMDELVAAGWQPKIT